jgi:sugar O-acyltransferase (sialic acid O-acetyltransferase NeuD family)
MDEQRIICEQYNANDDSYYIEYIIESGTSVSEGDLLLEIETSKSAIEIQSDFEGYFYTNLQSKAEVLVGDFLGLVSAKKINFKDQKQPPLQKGNDKKHAKALNQVVIELPPKTKKIAIIGGGKGFEQIFDMLSLLPEYSITGIYDDQLFKEGVEEKYKIPILGEVSKKKILKNYYNGLFNSLVISVSSNIKFRSNWYNKLKEIIPFSTIIHPKANISNFSSIDQGNIIFQFCSISFQSSLGPNCFLSAYTNIEHHCKIGSNITTGPGVMLSGGVKIEDNVKFGTGVFIEPNLTIKKNSVIGSGAVITKDVDQDSVIIPKGELIIKENKWR